MDKYKGGFDELIEKWELKEEELWVDYQVLGPMFASLRMFLSMEDVLSVIVGSKGCLNHLRFTIIAWGEEDFHLGKKPIPLLEYDQKDIITGDYSIPDNWFKKIKELAEHEKANMIVLLPTDPINISGVNLEPIANDIKEKVGIQTTYIPTSAISGANQWEGYQAALEALYKPFLDKEYEKQDTVNLVGWMWPSRKREHEIGACIDMLKQIDIEVESVITGGSSVKDIEESMKAKANAMVCSAVAGDLFYKLEEKGIKLAAIRSPYGNEGTKEWLTEIATALGKDKKDKINQLEELYKKDFKEIKETLKDKKVFVSGGPGRLIGLLHTLSDYEVDIQSAALFWPHPWSQKDLRHMKEKHSIDIKNIIVSPGLDDLEQVANNYEVDLWLGGYQEQHIAKKYDIPFVPITVYTSPHVGFEGVVNLGNKLKLALEGYDFTENILKAKEIQPCIYRLNEKE
ncbi:MAG TPA: nitrogenase component 1 [Halanaerobiales bacterium]|nr:nitrogenase component 1 [Halanaerobiales bacterium]